MEAHKTMLIFGLICLWATLQPTALAAYSMSETCKYYPLGYIANPTDCQSWGYCKNGALYATGKCGAGFRYNSKTQMCDYASNVRCLTNVHDTCAEVRSATYVGDPADCNRYCYCENGVALQCHNCPGNQVFNPNTPACDYPSDYQCPAESICRLVANNQFVGDPDKCGSYLRCVGGSGISGSCSTGVNKYFNPLTGNCEATNPCTQGSTSKVTPAPDIALCTSNYDTIATTARVRYVSDPNSCYGYFACSSKNGLGTWLSCPFGLEFSQTAQKCILPAEVTCTQDRCANINAQFMTVPNSSCEKYVVCTNGVASATQNSCGPTGFPYFDEVNGGCVKDKPSYAICQ